MSPLSIATLEDVAHEQSRARITLRFSSTIETLYRAESVSERRNFVVLNWVIGCVLYDLFLISDYLVAGNDFYNYVIGRIFLLTPITAALLIFLFKRDRYFDTLSCFVPIAFSIDLTVLIIMGHGGYRGNYLFGDILLIICGYVISRPPLYHAAVTAIIQCLAFLTTMMFSDVVSSDGKPVSILFCLSGAVVTIMTAYALEKATRRAFLLGLRVRLLNEQLAAMAMADPLTGLGNRRMFEDVTTRFWGDASAEPAQASFILIDVDKFKSFNDSQGHSAGDLCLKDIGKCIVGAIRESDLAVRFGGEEIIVFLPHTDFADARRIAESIRLAIVDAAIPHPIIDLDAVVTASLGVAMSLTSDSSPAELVIRADTALYAAKRNGRNQVWPPIGQIEKRRAMPAGLQSRAG